MGHKTEPHSIGVCVYAANHGENGLLRTQDELFEATTALANAIAERVPEADLVQLGADEAEVCEFCGALWVTDLAMPHNNGCCPDDEANVQLNGADIVESVAPADESTH